MIGIFDSGSGGLTVLRAMRDRLASPDVLYFGAFKNSKNRLLLTATPATVKSGLYRSGFKMIGKDVVEVSIPDLAGAIEFGEDEEVLEGKIREAFTDIRSGDFDVLVLACTHYPLILPIFQRVLGASLPILDPAQLETRWKIGKIN